MDDTKHFDVARPGQSAAGPSSRPIIVDRKPIMQDPMVAGTNAAAPVPLSQRTTITPPSSEQLTQNTTTVSTAISPGTVITPAAIEVQIPQTVAEEKTQKVDQAAKQAEEQRVHAEEVEKLAESKKFAVPIGETHKSNMVHHLIIAAVAGLLISFVILYLAIDAGYIQTNITLPIDLIQNK